MASVRKRVTGRGASVWDVRYRDNRGRPRSRTFKRAEDARVYAKTVEADLVRGDFLDPAKGRRKFDEFASQWLASCAGLKPKTIVGYTSMLNRHVLPAFSGLAIAKIERSDVREFLGQAQLVGWRQEPFDRRGRCCVSSSGRRSSLAPSRRTHATAYASPARSPRRCSSSRWTNFSGWLMP